MPSTEKQLNVSKSNCNEIDDDFAAIRRKFDVEMQRMENEMSKFRTKLGERRKSCDVRALSPGSRQHEMGSFADSVASPLITETADGRLLTLKFDVTDFAPEEVVVKTVDNKLQVHAKHEQKSDSRSEYREYNREFLLPDGTNAERIRSSLSLDGVLTVEAQLPRVGQRRAPIDSKH